MANGETLQAELDSIDFSIPDVESGAWRAI